MENLCLESAPFYSVPEQLSVCETDIKRHVEQISLIEKKYPELTSQVLSEMRVNEHYHLIYRIGVGLKQSM